MYVSRIGKDIGQGDTRMWGGLEDEESAGALSVLGDDPMFPGFITLSF